MNRPKTPDSSATPQPIGPMLEEARRRILPSRQPRSVRSPALMASAGIVVCALGLVTVRVGARQALVRAQQRADAQAHLAAVQAGNTRSERADAVLYRVSEHSSPERTVEPSRVGQTNDEMTALRHKLDVLEQLLVRNQQENAELRQRIKVLTTQNERGAQKNSAQVQEARRRVEAAQEEALHTTQSARRRAETEEADAMRSQKQAMETMVKDLLEQQALLETRSKQAEALYRNGVGNAQDLTHARAEQDANRLRIQAAQEQLRAAQAGRKVSQKEQNLAQLRLSLAELKARMQQEQAMLTLVKTRHEAGTVPASEVLEVEAKVNATRVEIDQIQVKLSQEGAH